MLQLKDADRIAFLIVKYGLTAFFKFNADKGFGNDESLIRKQLRKRFSMCY
jgi:hypothetical protein